MKRTSSHLKVTEITEPQRQCLSHILRNCEQAITGLVSIIEDRSAKLSTEDLVASLASACRNVNRVMKAAKRRSFCAALPRECKFTSVFVKCSGIPDKGIKSRSSSIKSLAICDQEKN